MKERNLTLKRAKTLLKKEKTKEGWGEEMDTILIKKINTKKTTIKLLKGNTDSRKNLNDYKPLCFTNTTSASLLFYKCSFPLLFNNPTTNTPSHQCST
jgi:hypothetical protein